MNEKHYEGDCTLTACSHCRACLLGPFWSMTYSVAHGGPICNDCRMVGAARKPVIYNGGPSKFTAYWEA